MYFFKIWVSFLFVGGWCEISRIERISIDLDVFNKKCVIFFNELVIMML